VHSLSYCAGLDTVLRCLLYRDEVPSTEWILFSHHLGLLARVSLAFFFVVPVVVAIWNYCGFLVWQQYLNIRKYCSILRKNMISSTSNSGKCIWLLGHNSELSVHNKLTLYKQVIRPVWSYGIQLWGCASESNIQVIQRYQNKVLKCIDNAPWYVRNSDLHRDLRIETVTDIIAKFAKSHEKRLQDHINIEASRLLNVNITRRLKRKKPFELVIR
jgi:uncharacterized protein YeeX (DUF496 family)